MSRISSAVSGARGEPDRHECSPERSHERDLGYETKRGSMPQADRVTLSADCRQAFRQPFREPFRTERASPRQRVDRVTPMIEGMEHRDQLLTVQELAEYLGVPVATLYQWRHRHEGPPGFRVGRHVRYRWSDIQKWIEHQLESSPSHFTSHVISTVASGGSRGSPGTQQSERSR